VQLFLCAAGTAAIASTALGVPLASAATHPAQVRPLTPTSAVVGTGLVNCAVTTGEVGYSPASISGGTSAETISIWFKSTKCSAAATGTKPVPTSVIASMSFSSIQGNACPLLGTLGKGTLNLTYNYPGVPSTVIDPSVAQSVTVTELGPYWKLAGQVTQGSYIDPSPTFSVELKPNGIGTQGCPNGITSEYIARSQGPLTNV
jgi:hypothetical protein